MGHICPNWDERVKVLMDDITLQEFVLSTLTLCLKSPVLQAFNKDHLRYVEIKSTYIKVIIKQFAYHYSYFRMYFVSSHILSDFLKKNQFIYLIIYQILSMDTRTESNTETLSKKLQEQLLSSDRNYYLAAGSTYSNVNLSSRQRFSAYIIFL